MCCPERRAYRSEPVEERLVFASGSRINQIGGLYGYRELLALAHTIASNLIDINVNKAKSAISGTDRVAAQ